jgi:S1-C subfamily serine protease
MNLSKLRALAIVMLSLIGVNAALFGLLALRVYEAEDRFDEDADPQLPQIEVRVPAQSPEPLPDELASDEQRSIRIFRNAAPSVVFITTIAVRTDLFRRNAMAIPQGTGSGFLWDDKGHIVTNFHVVKGADAARVTLSDHSSYSARLVGAAADKDIAVLHIDVSGEKLRPLPRGTSADLLVGQQTLAIGNPFGLDHTLSVGVVSGLGREIKSIEGRPIFGVIQTDAAINPGNSGGPLLDSRGRLVGINTAIYSPSGASAGIGFAVPVDIVNRIVPELIAHGKVTRPGLGIRFDPAVSRQAGVKGVLVLGVVEGSPAEEAGIQPTRRDPRTGDLILGDVIVAIDGTKVESEKDLFRALDTKKVGDSLKVKIQRGRQETELSVTLGPLDEVE